MGIFQEFHLDLAADEHIFERECQRWTKLTVTSPAPYSTLEKALEVATEASYPNIGISLMILLCMPVATATADRSFSTMRRVKTRACTGPPSAYTSFFIQVRP